MKRLQTVLLSAGLVALAVAVPVQAADSLYVCESGQPFLWPSDGVGIPFNPDQGDLRDGVIDNPTGVALVQASFDQWSIGSATTVTYANAGPLPVDVDITNYLDWLEPVAPDGYSAIVFDATGEIFDELFGAGSGILGFAGPEWLNPVTCEVLEGRSFLNGPAFDDLIVAEDIMVHEFGHYTNLGHVELNGQLLNFSEGNDDSGPSPANPFPVIDPFAETIETMFPFYFDPLVGTRTPHADDIAAMGTLYPAAGFFAATGSITGTIYAPDGVTPLSGVNVIARNVANPYVDSVSTFSGAFGCTPGLDNCATAPADVGVYALNNLTPGAEYVVFVDQVTGAFGRFANEIITIPGPEEYWNADEANVNPPDDPQVATLITPAAGSPVSGTDIFFNGFSPGDPLPVGDDGFVEIFMPFTYSICGQDYDSVFINANGSITFGAGDTDFSESTPEHLMGPPRVAGLWDDLNPSVGGSVFYTQSANTFTVHYDNVPEWFSTGANSFDITLHRASNNVDIDYYNVEITDGLAGISCGGAITSGFEVSEDLTALQDAAGPDGRINTKPQPARFEDFGTNDLDGVTLLFNPTATYDDDWAEPNDTPNNKARRIPLPFDTIPVTRFTEIEPAGGDVDFYLFRGQAGLVLTAEILTGQLDTMMILLDSGLNILAFNDDSNGLLSKIQTLLPDTGYYYLGVTTFPDFGFTGAGGPPGGRYVLDMFTTDGLTLDLGDDDFEEVPLGFAFPYQGDDYSSVFVNSNGNLTFGGGDTDFSESVGEFLAENPRIAPLWTDLSPNQGGMITVEFGAGSATVNYIDVTEFLAGNSNNFSVTMASDGSVDIAFGVVDATSGLTGVTEGGGAADPGESDLSVDPCVLPGTTYELFSGDFDLFGSNVTCAP